MESDFAIARGHVERARRILAVEHAGARRMCGVLDLVIEALEAAEAENRSAEAESKMIWAPFALAPRPPRPDAG
ncbi:MAG TPA: hypothetical protein VGN97_20255 [Mesorhizobium sp.]|jgi:hypothetical protein|nr:hypothetical protein [Mesorhizobium sp.]